MSEEKLVNFRFEVGMYEELKMLALKERVSIKDLISRELIDYIKKHKDGNPQFKLDQFNDPNFVACPAFFRDSQSWNWYLSKQNHNDLEKFKNQILLIDKLMARFL